MTGLRHPQRFAARYGPWAVVTGASSGIGKATAGVLAAAGLGVVLVARSTQALTREGDDLRREFGVAVRVLTADLSDPAAVRRVVADTADLDVGLLVAAAGFGTSGAFLDADIDDERSMLAVNCAAVTELTWHFGRRMRTRDRGGIVLLASLVGRQGTPSAAHYAATKAYVQVLAEGLSAELRPVGIDVVAGTPGPVDSGFAERAGMSLSRTVSAEQVALGTLEALGRRPLAIPGATGKLLSWSLAPLPRRARTLVMGRVMSGFVQPARRELQRR